MSKPTPIADILRRRLAALGMTTRVKEASVEHVWPSLVGAEIAVHTHVIRTDAGRVFVAVDSAPWRQELMYQKEALLEKLNDALCDDGGRRIVTDIIFTGP